MWRYGEQHFCDTNSGGYCRIKKEIADIPWCPNCSGGANLEPPVRLSEIIIFNYGGPARDSHIYIVFLNLWTNLRWACQGKRFKVAVWILMCGKETPDFQFWVPVSQKVPVFRCQGFRFFVGGFQVLQVLSSCTVKDKTLENLQGSEPEVEVSRNLLSLSDGSWFCSVIPAVREFKWAHCTLSD